MEHRKKDFKRISAGSGETESRLRKHAEDLRREKRSLAKRVRALPIVDDGVSGTTLLPTSVSFDEVVSMIKVRNYSRAL